MSKVVIIGGGTMGRGIAHVSALARFKTTLQDVSQEALTKAEALIRKDLDAGVGLGKVSPTDRDAALAALSFATEWAPCAEQADLVIEAVPEDLGLKCELFRDLSAIAPVSCIFASNTSGLPIDEMAEASGRADRFVGMHFFNPVHKMKLVEIVKGKKTSALTLSAAVDATNRMGKESVVVNDSPGFVTSRINALIGNEAFRMLEAGIATPRDIDKALKLGLNHPMGPFELVDLVGLDVRLSILRHLHLKLGDLYRPAALLEKYVREGRLGKKVGKGVYDYFGMDSPGKGGPGFAK